MRIAFLIFAMCVARLAIAFDGAGGMPTFYNSTGSKQVKASGGRLYSVQAQGGTNPTVQVFDDEDGTCDENQRTGTITLVPDAAPLVFDYGLAVGICVLIGGTSPEVTVSVR